jgi:hypothetical protein
MNKISHRRRIEKKKKKEEEETLPVMCAEVRIAK